MRARTVRSLPLAALGACTAITVRMYAERKGWPLRHVTVRLRHRRIHAEEQRVRLLNIAEHCPVHRMLNSEVRITTTEN